MRHKRKAGLFFLSALLTFGILAATVGPRHFNHFRACASGWAAKADTTSTSTVR